MQLAALVLGAWWAGWALPELALAAGGRTDIHRAPLMLNVLCAFAAALIAYGLRA